MPAERGKYSAISPVASNLDRKLVAAHRPHNNSGEGYIRSIVGLGNLEVLMRNVMPHDAVTYALRLSPSLITQATSIIGVSLICSPYDFAST
eukprot:1535646-Pyramimonas_sp.AAC.1